MNATKPLADVSGPQAGPGIDARPAQSGKPMNGAEAGHKSALHGCCWVAASAALCPPANPAREQIALPEPAASDDPAVTEDEPWQSRTAAGMIPRSVGPGNQGVVAAAYTADTLPRTSVRTDLPKGAALHVRRTTQTRVGDTGAKTQTTGAKTDELLAKAVPARNASEPLRQADTCAAAGRNQFNWVAGDALERNIVIGQTCLETTVIKGGSEKTVFDDRVMGDISLAVAATIEQKELRSKDNPGKLLFSPTLSATMVQRKWKSMLVTATAHFGAANKSKGHANGVGVTGFDMRAAALLEEIASKSDAAQEAQARAEKKALEDQKYKKLRRDNAMLRVADRPPNKKSKKSKATTRRATSPTAQVTSPCAGLGVKCPVCLRAIATLNVEHTRICLGADAVRAMASITHMEAQNIPAFFGSVHCHSWQNSVECVAIVHAWCDKFGPHACMRKAHFRAGSTYCAYSANPYQGCMC